MHLTSLFTSLLVWAVTKTLAVPAPVLQKRAVTHLSSSDLSGLAPFTQFARAAYCPTSILKTWKCGGMSVSKVSSNIFGTDFLVKEACAANSDFQPTLVGGDGNDIQICELFLRQLIKFTEICSLCRVLSFAE